MSQFEVTIKKIQFGAEATHQETLNFSCDIYIGNKKVAYAMNEGHGGNTNVRPYHLDDYSLLKEVEAYYKNKPDAPAESFDGYFVDFIDDFVGKAYDAKQLAKLHKKIEKLCLNHLVIGNAKRYAEGTMEHYSIVKYAKPIADFLKNPNLKELLKSSIAKQAASLKEGEDVLNTNLGDIYKP